MTGANTQTQKKNRSVVYTYNTCALLEMRNHAQPRIAATAAQKEKSAHLQEKSHVRHTLANMYSSTGNTWPSINSSPIRSFRHIITCLCANSVNTRHVNSHTVVSARVCLPRSYDYGIRTCADENIDFYKNKCSSPHFT